MLRADVHGRGLVAPRRRSASGFGVGQLLLPTEGLVPVAVGVVLGALDVGQGTISGRQEPDVDVGALLVGAVDELVWSVGVLAELLRVTVSPLEVCEVGLDDDERLRLCVEE